MGLVGLTARIAKTAKAAEAAKTALAASVEECLEEDKKGTEHKECIGDTGGTVVGRMGGIEGTAVAGSKGVQAESAGTNSSGDIVAGIGAVVASSTVGIVAEQPIVELLEHFERTAVEFGFRFLSVHILLIIGSLSLRLSFRACLQPFDPVHPQLRACPRSSCE